MDFLIALPPNACGATPAAFLARLVARLRAVGRIADTLTESHRVSRFRDASAAAPDEAMDGAAVDENCLSAPGPRRSPRAGSCAARPQSQDSGGGGSFDSDGNGVGGGESRALWLGVWQSPGSACRRRMDILVYPFR